MGGLIRNSVKLYVA